MSAILKINFANNCATLKMSFVKNYAPLKISFVKNCATLKMNFANHCTILKNIDIHSIFKNERKKGAKWDFLEYNRQEN